MNRVGRLEPKRAFVIRDVDSRMTRKYPGLSKGARNLWLPMLGMANAKTGELRHKTYWFRGKDIDRRAEISDRTRQKQMKELVRNGFVRTERERTEGVLTDELTGHKRWRKGVLGNVHFFVSKLPREDWLSSIEGPQPLRKHCTSTTRNFSQSLQSLAGEKEIHALPPKSRGKARCSTRRKVYPAGRISATNTSINHLHSECGVSSCGFRKEFNNSQSSSVSNEPPVKSLDDDSTDHLNRIELLFEKAKAILAARGHDSDYVQLALDFIDQRSFDLGNTPASVAYYLASFDTLQQNHSENDTLWQELTRRRSLREKFGLPRDVTSLSLTQEQEEKRQMFNRRYAEPKRSIG